MLTMEISNLSASDRFLYWIEERHQIYLKRKSGKPKPWTNDEILQNFFFTCPYRENDKTTVWFREKIREPLKNTNSVMFATTCFRWFNWIPTGEVLIKHNFLTRWNQKKANKILSAISDKVFTGAYMISGKAYTGLKKTDCVCRLLEPIWQDRSKIVAEMREGQSIQAAHNILTQYVGLGGFMAYEIVCDLRYTSLLENAADKMTWCNPGPGCRRGLARINGWTIKSNDRPKLDSNWLTQMEKLLDIVNSKLSKMPNFEMREIEHSLCEWDKYERLRLKEGPSKRRYNGVS